MLPIIGPHPGAPLHLSLALPPALQPRHDPVFNTAYMWYPVSQHLSINRHSAVQPNKRRQLSHASAPPGGTALEDLALARSAAGRLGTERG